MALSDSHDELHVFFFAVSSSEDSSYCSLFPFLRIDGIVATIKYLDKDHQPLLAHVHNHPVVPWHHPPSY